MKNLSLILFISIALSIYVAANYLVFIRGWQSIPAITWLRYLYIILFITVSSCFILTRVLEKTSFHELTKYVTWIGSFWWSFLLYFLLIIAVLDLSRLLNHLFHFYPDFISNNYSLVKSYTLLISLVLVMVLNIAGYINAANPREKVLNLHIHKKVAGKKQLKIAMASDIHLGTLVGKKKLDRLVQSINGFQPDVVVLAGDILDEILVPVIKYDIGNPLRKIIAPLGVFAIPGNHEYIGGIEHASKYIESLNIKLLKDSVVRIDNSFYLIGRDDYTSARFGGKQRKELDVLMTNIDQSLPLILLDHQPYNLNQAIKNKIDLQLSGHTHHGQFVPLNFITSATFEVSWGYKQKGNTNIYVSSGYGTWGPPVRLGNKPEVVLITLEFDQ